MPVFDKQTLLAIFIIAYVLMVFGGGYFLFRSIYVELTTKKRFFPAIKRYMLDETDLQPKEFFDLALGCRLQRTDAINKVKSLLSTAENKSEFSKIHRLINVVEDYAPIQTSKVGLLVNLSALEKMASTDQSLSQHFAAVKNEISSLSEKFLEFEKNRRFNKAVAWLSVFGFIIGTVGLWYSINSPTPDQIAAGILKIQSHLSK